MIASYLNRKYGLSSHEYKVLYKETERTRFALGTDGVVKLDKQIETGFSLYAFQYSGQIHYARCSFDNSSTYYELGGVDSLQSDEINMALAKEYDNLLGRNLSISVHAGCAYYIDGAMRCLTGRKFDQDNPLVCIPKNDGFLFIRYTLEQDTHFDKQLFRQYDEMLNNRFLDDKPECLVTVQVQILDSAKVATAGFPNSATIYSWTSNPR